ncbi:MAG TPA: TlpA disulfide reductase family protein [Pseudonocardiaceae bacterium]|jgi:cytochrome c biogenesis protein CcmG/thiol:disulfide interchange protein DsbE
MSVGVRRGLLLTGVLAVVAIVAALLTSGLRHDPSATASPLVGRAAPDFTLPELDGPPVHLAALRGQVVVVNFWASWCTECHTEQPALNATWARFRDSGVVVLGVDFEDNDADARDYIASEGSDYPVVVDANSNTALAFGVRGVPETYVLDRSGRIVDRIIGAVDAPTLEHTLDLLVGGGAQ